MDAAGLDRRQALRLLPPIVVGMLAVGVFFFLVGREATPGAGAHPVAVTGSTLQKGTPPPDFSGVAFDGSTVHLGALRGHVVLVNFFASWCVACRSEMPAIQAEYHAKQSSGFDVIGVDALETGDGRGFYHEMGATFPALLDPGQGGRNGAIARAYGIQQGLPVSVFIGRDGRVSDVIPGGVDAQIIRQEIAALGIR